MAVAGVGYVTADGEVAPEPAGARPLEQRVVSAPSFGLFEGAANALLKDGAWVIKEFLPGSGVQGVGAVLVKVKG